MLKNIPQLNQWGKFVDKNGKGPKYIKKLQYTVVTTRFVKFIMIFRKGSKNIV